MLPRFFIVSVLFYGLTAFPQNPDEFRQYQLSGQSEDIINGTKWIYEKRYLGSPMLMEKYWPKSDILYRGNEYTGIIINYDLYKNEIILYHAEKGREKYVVISKDYLSGFSFTDTVTRKKHFFEYVELPGIRGKSLYERAIVGKLKLYIKPLKRIQVKSTGKGQGEFINFYEYYLGTENGYINFHSKNQFVKLLATHSTELSRFIRRNNLRINPSYPDDIMAVLRYFDSLN